MQILGLEQSKYNKSNLPINYFNLKLFFFKYVSTARLPRFLGRVLKPPVRPDGCCSALSSIPAETLAHGYPEYSLQKKIINKVKGVAKIVAIKLSNHSLQTTWCRNGCSLWQWFCWIGYSRVFQRENVHRTIQERGCETY